ncbi:sensor histidine kinase [Kineococcus indalonis]|uniref:sensor histidine kinase n=1 Tax=Kineococcus indalonis TaxID=2696566 RepID=UPI0014126B32|nr:sensor domain-containing protein [Kineococcus indalonis]NAZ86569.1 sensor histidine kinase [Kineococcus indalonis]
MDAPVPAGRLQRFSRGFRFLVDGLATGLAAWFVLLACLACLVPVVSLPLLPRAARAARALTALERARVARHLQVRVPAPPAVPATARAVLADAAVRRDAAFLLVHAVVGTLAGVVAVSSPIGAVQNVVLALTWPLFPAATTTLNTPVQSWPQAGVALLLAAAYAALGPLVVPPLARWHLRTSAALLAPPRESLVERLAEVTATRAAALDAHATELRRIERDLHDGIQNRMVAVVVHLGAAERALRRDPVAALPFVLTAHSAADQALADLRAVVRSIYPPVLADRGLAEAVSGLAAHSSVPCTVRTGALPRIPAAVEAAAYAAVAEGLTNAAKHSGARRVDVHLGVRGGRLVVEVSDDGGGGAQEARGTGLSGIRRRVQALDGTVQLHSPAGGPTLLRIAVPVPG